MEAEIARILREHPELGWINAFLTEHPRGELFLVGGAVRDALLNRKTQDFDFVITGATTDQIESWFGKRGTVDFVGRNFGVYKFVSSTLTIRPGKIEPIDLALPRTETPLEGSEGGYKEFAVDARIDLPIEIDLGRRDFTVNAIAYNVRTERLVDPFNGLRDLESKTLRAVGNAHERFKEDLSRLLRAIRFSCTLSFHIEEHTWKAIIDTTPNINNQTPEGGWVVPREAVGREFLKSFLHDPVCTLVKYEASGLHKMLFPEIDPALAQSRVEDVTGLTPRLLVALFLSATDPTDARRIGERFHFQQFPKEHRCHIDLEEVLWLIRSAHALDIVENIHAMPGSLFERLFLGPKGEDVLALIALTNSAPKEKIAAVQSRIAHIKETFGDEIPELLSGDDLIAAGVKPGPQFRTLKTKIRDAQFASQISSKSEALDYLMSLL